MAKHIPVRTMADVKEPLVLFLIGMRINTFWRVWSGSLLFSRCQQ